MEIVRAMQAPAFDVQDLSSDAYIDWIVESSWRFEGVELVVASGSAEERGASLVEEMLGKGLASRERGHRLATKWRHCSASRERGVDGASADRWCPSGRPRGRAAGKRAVSGIGFTSSSAERVAWPVHRSGFWLRARAICASIRA